MSGHSRRVPGKAEYEFIDDGLPWTCHFCGRPVVVAANVPCCEKARALRAE